MEITDHPALITIASYIPEDHFYRYLHHVLDLSFVRDLVADCYASGGRPSIDLEISFRPQLAMFFEQSRSERMLMEWPSRSLAIRCGRPRSDDCAPESVPSLPWKRLRLDRIEWP